MPALLSKQAKLILKTFKYFLTLLPCRGKKKAVFYLIGHRFLSFFFFFSFSFFISLLRSTRFFWCTGIRWSLCVNNKAACTKMPGKHETTDKDRAAQKKNNFVFITTTKNVFRRQTHLQILKKTSTQTSTIRKDEQNLKPAGRGP